mmetsp:Transcript_16375/g.48804  ORF Transcript_16375/g.48804 Transcript_16375/m.48804 type:complete len:218 (+) Transcript_16375:97-750(+)
MLPKMRFSDQLTFGGGPPGSLAACPDSSSTSLQEVTSPRRPKATPFQTSAVWSACNFLHVAAEFISAVRKLGDKQPSGSSKAKVRSRKKWWPTLRIIRSWDTLITHTQLCSSGYSCNNQNKPAVPVTLRWYTRTSSATCAAPWAMSTNFSAHVRSDNTWNSRTPKRRSGGRFSSRMSSKARRRNSFSTGCLDRSTAAFRSSSVGSGGTKCAKSPPFW